MGDNSQQNRNGNNKINNNKVIKEDFFSKPKAEKVQQPVIKAITNVQRPIQPDKRILDLFDETARLISSLKMDFLIPELKKISLSIKNTYFTVAVVGDFSRGKSTLVNKLLGNNILPTGNDPTTVMLTQVTYNDKPMIVHVNSKGDKNVLPLKTESWEGLTANIDDSDPEGTVFVGVDNPWLFENNIQIIDTPGTGDINLKRSSIVNEALFCCDGMIMTISALSPMSQTEKLFINQRILAKKVPHLMVVITRMDQLSTEERLSIINYVSRKLDEMGVAVSIFIPQDIQIPESRINNNIGIASIKEEIKSWSGNSNHNFLKMQSFCVQIEGLLDIALDNLEQRKKVISLTDDQKKEAINKQKANINKTKERWLEYKREMQKRAIQCCEWMKSLLEEKQTMIFERMQYEMEHASNPQTWWEKDLPYRLRTEMTAMASSLENGLCQYFVNDIRWANDSINKEFNMCISVKKEALTDKSDFQPTSIANVKFEDLNKLRIFARVGSSALNICGYMLAPTGLGIIGSTVAGASSSIITEKLINKKVTEQRNTLRTVLEKEIPNVFDNTINLTLKRINAAYNKIIAEIDQQEKLWFDIQSDIIEKTVNSKTDKEIDIEKTISSVIEFKKKLTTSTDF